MPKQLKVVDKSDDIVIDMGMLMNVPMRGLICARSGAGKSNLMVNILLSPEFPYNKIFKDGSQIYIMSGSINSDEKVKKMIDVLDIPESNKYDGYDNDALNLLYNNLEEEYIEREVNKDKPEYPLIIIDDISFVLGRGQKFNALSRLAQNSRKLGISFLITTQHYSQVPKNVRNNITFAVLYKTSMSNLEQIEAEHNYLGSKKEFYSMWNSNVKSKRDFVCINYDNDNLDIYLNKDFEPIFSSSSPLA